MLSISLVSSSADAEAKGTSENASRAVARRIVVSMMHSSFRALAATSEPGEL
jgi:hypothetical protein